MSLTVLILQNALFLLNFWLGCYLIARDPGRLHLWLAGLGTITFATGMATVPLSEFAPSASMALTLYRVQRLFVVLPALLISSAAAALIQTFAHLVQGLQYVVQGDRIERAAYGKHHWLMFGIRVKTIHFGRLFNHWQ
jgi:hypothetical protein